MARKKGPGRVHHKGISVIELFKMFPDEHAVQTWFGLSGGWMGYAGVLLATQSTRLFRLTKRCPIVAKAVGRSFQCVRARSWKAAILAIGNGSSLSIW